MTTRRELWLAVLLCLAGSALVLFGAAQVWATVEASQLGDTALRLKGDQVSAPAQALGYVGLAAVVALAATKKLGRVVVGMLVLAAGTGIVVALARVLHTGLASLALQQLPGRNGRVSSSPSWVWVALVGGGLMALSGLLVALRGPRWAALSSSYEAPAARAAAEPVTDKGVWDALDRGEDPT